MKIAHNKRECIGCGACVGLCPEYFELEEGGRAHLKGSKLNSKTGKYELEIESAGCSGEVADVCPAQCIYLVE